MVRVFHPQEVVEEEAGAGGVAAAAGGPFVVVCCQASGEGVEAAVLEVASVVRQGGAQRTQLPAQDPLQQSVLLLRRRLGHHGEARNASPSSAKCAR